MGGCFKNKKRRRIKANPCVLWVHYTNVRFYEDRKHVRLHTCGRVDLIIRVPFIRLYHSSISFQKLGAFCVRLQQNTNNEGRVTECMCAIQRAVVEVKAC